MYKTMKTISILAILGVLLITLTSCPLFSTTPEIVGCDSFRYAGTTISNAGCNPTFGSCPSSFTLWTSRIPDVEFSITCSGCCITSVTVLDDAKALLLEENGTLVDVVERVEPDGSLAVYEYYDIEEYINRDKTNPDIHDR